MFLEKLLNAPIIYSFRDLVLLPGLSVVEPDKINLSTRFSKNVKINIPFASSPMDTVTGPELAIALAQEGGIGIIHRNCSCEDQVSMVKKVKEVDVKSEVAAVDEDGKLVVGGAVSPFDVKRAKALEKYVDVIVIDVAHAHNENVIRATKKIINEVAVDVVVGNIGTYEAAEEYLTKVENIAGFRVGIGGGSICITSSVTKVFASAAFATANVAQAVYDYKADIPIISDGGIRTPGDVAVALALGASCVMMGNIFAGCKESPGKLVILGGNLYKEYYGMASAKAKAKRMAIDRYSSKKIIEGVEGLVPYRGSVKDVIREFVEGLKAAMGYAGARNIEELWTKAKVGIVTPLAVKEAAPHDLLVNIW